MQHEKIDMVFCQRSSCKSETGVQNGQDGVGLAEDDPPLWPQLSKCVALLEKPQLGAYVDCILSQHTKGDKGPPLNDPEVSVATGNAWLVDWNISLSLCHAYLKPCQGLRLQADGEDGACASLDSESHSCSFSSEYIP